MSLSLSSNTTGPLFIAGFHLSFCSLLCVIDGSNCCAFWELLVVASVSMHFWSLEALSSRDSIWFTVSVSSWKSSCSCWAFHTSWWSTESGRSESSGSTGETGLSRLCSRGWGVALLGLLCVGGLGGVLLGMLPLLTPSMSESLYLAMVGVTSFFHQGARCGSLGRRTLI